MEPPGSQAVSAGFPPLAPHAAVCRAPAVAEAKRLDAAGWTPARPPHRRPRAPRFRERRWDGVGRRRVRVAAREGPPCLDEAVGLRAGRASG